MPENFEQSAKSAAAYTNQLLGLKPLTDEKGNYVGFPEFGEKNTFTDFKKVANGPFGKKNKQFYDAVKEVGLASQALAKKPADSELAINLFNKVHIAEGAADLLAMPKYKSAVNSLTQKMITETDQGAAIEVTAAANYLINLKPVNNKTTSLDPDQDKELISRLTRLEIASKLVAQEVAKKGEAAYASDSLKDVTFQKLIDAAPKNKKDKLTEFLKDAGLDPSERISGPEDSNNGKRIEALIDSALEATEPAKKKGVPGRPFYREVLQDLKNDFEGRMAELNPDKTAAKTNAITPEIQEAAKIAMEQDPNFVSSHSLTGGPVLAKNTGKSIT